MSRSGLSSGDKALRIIESIRDVTDQFGGRWVEITADFGDNTLTVALSDGGKEHIHVGRPGGSFEDLVDDLYLKLCERKWAGCLPA